MIRSLALFASLTFIGTSSAQITIIGGSVRATTLPPSDVEEAEPPPGVVMVSTSSGAVAKARGNPLVMFSSTIGLLTARPTGPLTAATSAVVSAQPGAVPDSPRMQRLKRLSFDRRPSSYLRAWAPKAAPKADPDAPPKTPLDHELESFQLQVTLGDWPAVKSYLAKLPPLEGKAAYAQLLQSLQQGPIHQAGPTVMMTSDGPVHQGGPRQPEPNSFSLNDLVGLITAAPHGLEKEHTAILGMILHTAITQQAVLPDAIKHLHALVDMKAPKVVLTSRQAAQLLMAAGHPFATAEFLPPLEKAVADKDVEALNLWARHYLGETRKEKRVAALEKAWAATQSGLALGTAGSGEDREEAVRRAVELAPKIKESLGQAWLDASFTSKPERGMEILGTIGAVAATGLTAKPSQPDDRLKVLELQKAAVDALLKESPERARQWRATLAVLAGAWMREADYTRLHAQRDNQMRRDRFGNRYWYMDDDRQQMMMRQRNQAMPIKTEAMLLTRPDKGWLDTLDEGPRSKLTILLAQLYLKADEENNAFPLIEQVAAADKDAARNLVHEFLRTWTTNHDPNNERQDQNPYFYFYGYEMSLNGIPLTRSKQERNLAELAGWVDRLRRLPIDPIDEPLLVEAFTKCHSSAEVYRLEAIERVFGPLAKIKPKTLAGLLQMTRANLVGQWREPAQQVQKKTNRKQKDIQREVLRGYELANTVAADAIKQFPDEWSLTLAKAALIHDETMFRQSLARSSDFSQKRAEAIAAFRKAADQYAAVAPKLAEGDETVQVYETWFNASLGACDLAKIDEDSVPDPRQAELIRQAIAALPRDCARRHLDQFANNLVTKLSAVKPASKHIFLKQGFAIVGDNRKAAEAKKVFDYYKDLVSEIRLDAVVDGPDRVGHDGAFGVFVNIRHTREIERESGGFGRYLVNQNSGTGRYFFNFGRPTADYRDRFESLAREALKEQFEVVSVTFQSEKVHSRAAREYGWRVTPYAYLLLKPRGAQVDKIPPMRLDLDFLDTSGYVVVPIESPAVPIDCTPAHGSPRPVKKLQVTQVLDERKAKEGTLGLEVKASAVGLVGRFDELLNFAPEGFDVVKNDDQGLSVAKYDEEGDGIAVVSERVWLLTLRAKPGQAAAPATFRFGSSKSEGTEMVYQRYNDADLAAASPEVALEQTYKSQRPLWMWVAAGAGLLLVLVALAGVLVALRRRPKPAAGLELPADLDPFTATVLLQRVRVNNNLRPADRERLEATIAQMERRYFAGTEANGDGADLRKVAEEWVRKGVL